MRTIFATSVLALAALSLSAPLFADDAAAPASATRPEKPKKICREAPVSSTSRIGVGRACRTQAQWDEIAAHGPQTSARAVQSTSADRN